MGVASDRLLNCARCQQQLRVCRRCDHGQRYCPDPCARQARHVCVRAHTTSRRFAAALNRRLRHYCRPALLVCDELGYLSYDARHADLLFEAVAVLRSASPSRYELWAYRCWKKASISRQT